MFLRKIKKIKFVLKLVRIYAIIKKKRHVREVF